MEKVVFSKTKGLNERRTIYCPGCGHGIAHRLVAEVLEEMGLLGKAVGVGSVGCSVFIYEYFNCDFTAAAHGRAPAVATGIKRVSPESIVFTYQGDGDLAAIGTAEIVHAANRGENITVFFVNNGVYGMTGGQMAPTTLISQKTTTTPFGRDPKLHGYPIPISELLSNLSGVAYLERVALTSPQNVLKAKKAVKNAFTAQVKGLGFSMVEFLSTCPTNWHMEPREALRYIEEVVFKYYPPKVFVPLKQEV
jgi:2-oxoglutarate ferredoxin oxidoreductase subunit beta